jgi:hypothetical protein
LRSIIALYRTLNIGVRKIFCEKRQDKYWPLIFSVLLSLEGREQSEVETVKATTPAPVYTGME